MRQQFLLAKAMATFCRKMAFTALRRAVDKCNEHPPGKLHKKFHEYSLKEQSKMVAAEADWLAYSISRHQRSLF